MPVYKVKVHSAPAPNEFIVSAPNRSRAENAVKNRMCKFIESEVMTADQVFSLPQDIERINVIGESSSVEADVVEDEGETPVEVVGCVNE